MRLLITVSQAGGFSGANVVLDAGVRAVAGFEELRGSDRRVGGEQLVALAVEFFEQRQLCAGVGLLAPADDPHVGWPGVQLVTVGSFTQQPGQFGNPGFGQVAGLAAGVQDRVPGAGGYRAARSRAPRFQPMLAVAVRDLGDGVVEDLDVVGQVFTG